MKKQTVLSLLASGILLLTPSWSTAQNSGGFTAPAKPLAQASYRFAEKGHEPGKEHLDEQGEGHKEHKSEKGNDGHEEEKGHAHGADDKDSKGEHGDEEHAAGISLSKDQIKLAEIKTITVSAGQIEHSVDLAGEVRVNEDRVVQVVPMVPGVVSSVRSYLGDYVEKGAVMAIIDSRQFADAKSSYVAARERAKLANIKFEREERLWEKKISSEQEYLDAEITMTEARITERTAAQKLLALGVSASVLKKISSSADQSLTRYEIITPLGGTVIEKHVNTGASVDQGKTVYRVADLKTLWVIASVYEKDIAHIQKNQTAAIITRAYPDREFAGRITWIADTFDEKTRTLKVRIEVDNKEKLLKPGMFVRASIVVAVKDGVLTVPVSAVRRQGGETIVFVAEDGGRFERRDVKLGAQSGQKVEVLNGLEVGQRVVSVGSFLLKSELDKEGFGGGHGH